MAVSITAVVPQNNPALFTDLLAFEIEYEALSNLQEDLTWKLIYVGSADNDRYDQVLEDVAVGPVNQGTFRFVLQANPPNPQLIPTDDVVGITVIMLTCSYRDKEFLRVGYFVNNEYLDDELRENPPEVPLFDRVQRSILADHPRVTRYIIPFDEPEPAPEAQPMDEGEPTAMEMGQQVAGAGGVPVGDGAMDGQVQMQPMHMAIQQGAFGQQGQAQQHLQYVPVQ